MDSSGVPFRRIGGEERKDLAENDFLYNLSHLAAFMNRKSFTWDRAHDLIYNDAPKEPMNVPKTISYGIVLAMIVLLLANLDLIL
mmetsp:Transcript_3744/g.3468  ORF Transcript_3744/g.3468 Transcript_3744/m.3468 type:complete len:85 (-) Transcript_3744:15-269(-)